MSIDVYLKAMSYENLMCRAFKTSDRSKPGIDISYMRNLIDAENGKDCVSHLPSYSIQMDSVKKYIDKAFDKLITRRRTDDKKRPLLELQVRTKNARNTSELLDIVEQALALTQDLKD